MFKKTAMEIAEKDFPNISESTVISELGIDSLGMLEIVGAMERQLKIQIPDGAREMEIIELLTIHQQG